MTRTHDVDVVIVGSGAAGLTAALAAYDNGCRAILVAEAEAVVGGASRLSGGIIMGAPTRLQRSNGIDDSADDVFHEYMLMNQWSVEPGPVRRFVEESGPTIDWLEELGVEFEPWVFPAGQEAVPHGHLAKGSGAGLIDALHAACKERGVDIALGRRVDRLLVHDGRVVGVAVGDDEVTAAATVIASGGFCANPEKIAAWWPDGLAGGDWAYYIAGEGAAGSRGDALDLGDAVGAEIVGRNRGLRLLHTGFHREFDAAPPGWLVMVNQAGRRFVSETAHYGVIDSVIKAQGDVAYSIFDDRLLRSPGIADSKWDRTGAYRPNYNVDLIDRMVAEGRVHAADTITGLAEAIGVGPETLAGTIERYNAGARAGRDVDHLKPSEYLQPLETPPYYAVEVRPASLAVTACGLRIDEDGRVVGRRGESIEGLFAAGECTGGILGSLYAGSGNSLANCVTFGRIAGRAASALVAAEQERSGRHEP
jgi:succinate dehydrogenase/fumarate reductase flavoprotein subunit